MTIAVISDTHIKVPGDEAYQVMESFLLSDNVVNSNVVVFLGDIFDLMVGSHQYYLEKFEAFFLKLEALLNQGKEVHFFEGNHDFHLKKLMSERFKDKSFFYHQNSFILKKWGKTFYFSHGDDLDWDNRAYKLTKFILRNRLFNKFVDKVPGTIVHYLGAKWSSHSRKKNKSYFLDPLISNQIKQKFRSNARQLCLSQKYDYIICGHSHIEDEYSISEGMTYLNNGYPPHSKKCILLSEVGHQLYLLP
ncbi:MAG: UDP-2,3-diacylglucosamine diphosphatase [Bacteriovoracaceae bacterium]